VAVDHRLVEPDAPVTRGRADGELGVVGHPQLLRRHDVEGGVEPVGDRPGHGQRPAWDTEDEVRVDLPLRERVGEPGPRISARLEHGRRYGRSR
jgi:hypothetical protein